MVRPHSRMRGIRCDGALKRGAMLEGLVRVLLLEEFCVGFIDAGVDLFESVGVVVVICLSIAFCEISEDPFSESSSDLLPGQVRLICESWGEHASFLADWIGFKVEDLVKNVEFFVVFDFSSDSSSFSCEEFVV